FKVTLCGDIILEPLAGNYLVAWSYYGLPLYVFDGAIIRTASKPPTGHPQHDGCVIKFKEDILVTEEPGPRDGGAEVGCIIWLQPQD
ncbi:hypothetical protein L873DRAFT_1625665, partial [Choiromyces venosus 120613-1]